MGAKNHGVILPDANKESTINALVGAAFGAAGQRYSLQMISYFFTPHLKEKFLSTNSPWNFEGGLGTIEPN